MHKNIKYFLGTSKSAFYQGDQLRLNNHPHTYVKIGGKWMKEEGPLGVGYTLKSISPGLAKVLNGYIASLPESMIPRLDPVA